MGRPARAGHYVKMVHNGIEYGDMQLICEAYWMLKEALGLGNDELYDVFQHWYEGELNSYLIEITRDIFSVKDPDTGGYLVDVILDTAGAKGTGKWMSQLALDLGVPSTLVTEAVYARCLSAMKDARVRASKLLARADGQVPRRPGEVHRASPPGALRLEDLQLRAGLRADAGGRRRAQVAAAVRRDRPACGGAGASSGPCSWNGSRRPFDAKKPPENLLLAPVFQDGDPQGADRLAQRGHHGRSAGHSHAGLRGRSGLLRRLPLRAAAGQPAAGAARLFRRPHLSAASTVRACFIAIGCGCGSNRRKNERRRRCSRVGNIVISLTGG